ncbi:Splicing factor 3B subunit 3 [Histomonas meleagridis]|uniref:Splicing factor 3B subunit 3 n=1 Tax=Histomonas meleagridis TaxID=135588 RepID=UPI00355A5201|nr:Splicing factor 3B subunit 3 [Histomonas meleagridis]KAH0802796.1 Splicing factor 3B subunit 3 [Histomonas meleagridis]
MKFLHQTIIRSQKVHTSVVLPASGGGFSEVLLFFRNYSQLFQVQNDNPENLKLYSIAKFPISLPIRWCFSVDDKLIAITSECHLLVLQATPPFKSERTGLLWPGLAPSSIPISHCVMSLNKQYLICSGFTKNLIVVQFNSDFLPTVTSINLTDILVLSVSPTETSNIFAFLVSLPDHSKSLLYFDVISQSEINRKPVPIESNKIIMISNSLFIISDTKIYFEDNKEIPLECPISLITPHPSNEYAFIQLVNGKLCRFYPHNSNLIEEGSRPLISSVHFLPRGLIFCVPEVGDCFVFSETSETSFPLFSHVTNAIFDNNDLILACGTNDLSRLIRVTNSLPYSVENFDGIENFENNSMLFAVTDKALIVSNGNGSFVLFNDNDMNLSESPTVFANDVIQVHRRGIKKLNSTEVFKIDDDIISADANDECIAIITKGMHVILLNYDFVVITDREIMNAYKLKLCSDLVAIATKNTNGGNSALSLYAFDLIPPDIEVQLTSTINELVFLPNTNELYASLQNCYVLKWNISEPNYPNTRVIVYSNNSPSLITSIGDNLLISSDKTFIIDRNSILQINIPKINAITVNSDHSFYLIDETNHLKLITLERIDIDLVINSMPLPTTPRKVIKSNNEIYTLCRSHINNNFISFIRNNKIEGNLGILSAQIIHPNEIIAGFIRNDNLGVLMLLDEALHCVQSIELPQLPFSLARYNDYILVGVGKRLHILKHTDGKWCAGKDSLASFHTQIAFIEIWGKYFLIGDRLQSVFCFEPKIKDGMIVRLALIAIDCEQRQLTSLAIYNEEIIVVGDKFGMITFLKLPDDVIAGTPWNMSQPLERGVFMPTTSLMIKLASFNVNEAVTSILKPSPLSPSVYYVTLMGEVGCLTAIEQDEDFAIVADAEIAAEKILEAQERMMVHPKIKHGKICTASIDVFEMIEEDEMNMLQIPIEKLRSILFKIKALAKF